MRLTKLLIMVALFLLFLLFSFETLEEWKGAKGPPPRSYVAAKNQIPSPTKTENRRGPNENDYRDIIEHNLFSPNRVEYVPIVTAPGSTGEVDQLPATATKFTLFGIVLMDDYKRALISAPSPKAGEPADIWIKVGDTVGSLKVEDIFEQSILVLEDGKQYQIPLYDKGNPKTRVIMPKEQSAVTVTNVEKTQSVPKVENKVNADKKSTSEDEYINTPFGKVKRKK